MELGNKVQGLLKSQKDILREYEELFKEISLDDPINENIRMKKEIEDIRKNLVEAEERVTELQQENMSIRTSLRDQMLNERGAILNGSKQKMKFYFDDAETQGINKLQSLEYSVKNRINKLNAIIFKELQDQDEEISRAIARMELEIEEKISIQKERLKQEKVKLIDEMKREYDTLQKEQVSDEALAKRQKHNDIEVSIGLNWINKVGMIILLLGVATAMKYTYSVWFNDYMKGISGFLLGGGLLAIGEWMNKKNKNLFALGLCGGGIGTLYLTVFSCYFFLNILNLPISVMVSVLITLVSLALSKRYSSMTIAGISLFGGYLPFFSFAFIQGIEGSQVYIAMGYLIILNLLVLAIAFGSRWIYINYLSFLFNMPCLIYLALSSSNEIIGIAYAILTFMMYLGITLAYPIRRNIKLNRLDITLLGLNTVINCLLVYGLFETAGLGDYKGFLALIYAASYFGLSRLIFKKTFQEKHVQALFSITALTFAILMIPFQFGIEWATMGWLIEAILMLTLVRKYNTNKLENGGWIILGLCTSVFFIHDFSLGWDLQYFALRYSSLTLGLIYAFSLYVSEYNKSEFMKYIKKGQIYNGLKYFIVLNTWVYLLRMVTRAYDQYFAIKLPESYIDFYKLMIITIMTIAFAYVVLKIEAIRDKVVIGIATALLVLANLSCIAVNLMSVGSYSDETLKLISMIILVLYNILVFITVKDLTIKFVRRNSFSIEYYPLTIAIYLLGITTLFLTRQFNLENINLIISIIFVIMAFSCIAFGFKKHYLLIRRFGLGLSIFSTGKLFFFDLHYLNGIGRIIAYFCFGLILIGISFIYQRLRTSIEEAKANEESL